MGADLTHITGTKSNLGALVVSERASEHAGRCLPLAVPLSPPSGSLSECPPLTTPAPAPVPVPAAVSLNRPPHTHSHRVGQGGGAGGVGGGGQQHDAGVGDGALAKGLGAFPRFEPHQAGRPGRPAPPLPPSYACPTCSSGSDDAYRGRLYVFLTQS